MSSLREWVYNATLVVGTADALVALVSFFLMGSDSAGVLEPSPEMYIFLATECSGSLLLTYLCFKCASPLGEGHVDFKKPDTYFTGLFFISYFAFQFVTAFRTNFDTGSAIGQVLAVANEFLRLLLTIPLTKCLMIGQPADLSPFERLFMGTMLTDVLIRNVGAQLQYPTLLHGMIEVFGKDLLFLAITKPCSVVYLFRCIQHVLGLTAHQHDHDPQAAHDNATADNVEPPRERVAAREEEASSRNSRASHHSFRHSVSVNSIQDIETLLGHNNNDEEKSSFPAAATVPLLLGAAGAAGGGIPVAHALVIVLGLAGFAMMYGADVLDRAQMKTDCAYEYGRISLCLLSLLLAWPLYARNNRRRLSNTELFLFAGQVCASVGTILYLAFTTVHAKFSCENNIVMLVNEGASLAFALMQFWVVFLNHPPPSRARYFLAFASLGMVWFDFSDEAQHLLHWNTMSDDEDSIQKRSFLGVQCVFWMGVEFKVLAVETLFE